tara:strand:+ start:3556 stop:3984 length:429 start_codon:yes stop_codon:yes gene_type:complete
MGPWVYQSDWISNQEVEVRSQSDHVLRRSDVWESDHNVSCNDIEDDTSDAAHESRHDDTATNDFEVHVNDVAVVGIHIRNFCISLKVPALSNSGSRSLCDIFEFFWPNAPSLHGNAEVAWLVCVSSWRLCVGEPSSAYFSGD